MTITVTEEMRAAALRELRGELTDEELELTDEELELTDEELEQQAAEYEILVQGLDKTPFPGQVKPSWDEISESLDKLLTPVDAGVEEESPKC